MKFYATYDPRADINNGNRGFANTIEVVRFDTRVARDAFAIEEGNRDAQAVTRKEAADAFASTYLSVGHDVPRGLLFGNLVEWIPHEGAPGDTASTAFYAKQG